MHIVLSDDAQGRSDIGAKTLNLQTMKKAGLPVPPFVALPCNVIQLLLHDQEAVLSQIIEDIRTHLPCNRYAVRSSALVEDGKDQSNAGRFRTRINVQQEELGVAILDVIADADKKSKNIGEQFSILIQEYIAADIAGVTFTRNPLGGREMIVEYHRGIGEDLVSGKITPHRTGFYWSQNVADSGLPNFANATELWKRIETLFAFPQDIEWCVRCNEWFILQSRPITTLDLGRYEEFLFLDSALPTGKKFFYEKTEISEIAPRPTPVTLSLLKMMYSQKGPVARVYQQYSVSYEAIDFLVMIGNELFIDREKELHTLLPSYSYFVKTDLSPRPARLSGLWKTLRNMKALKKIDTAKHLNRVQKHVDQELQKPILTTADLSESTLRFLDAYSLVFEVNMLAAKALKDLEKALEGKGMTAAGVLGGLASVEIEDKVVQTIEALHENLRGNSLELADESPFFRQPASSVPIPEIEQWWSQLTESEQATLTPVILNAKRYDRLREYGRWITVKKVTAMRNVLRVQAKKHGVEKEMAFFATLEEWMHHPVAHQQLQTGKKEHADLGRYSFPSRLVDTYLADGNAGKPVGVSPGVAEGRLVTADTIAKIKGSKILWTSVLHPELTQYFDQIEGILSEEGGLLSHLAIIAREQGLPVIAQFKLSSSGITIGDTVHVDGTNGTVQRL